MVRKRRILVVTIVALSLAACSNDDSDATTTEPPVELPAETAAIEDDADDQSATGPPYEVSESTISHETTQQIAVWAPTADGTWPIITIAHGMGGSHQNMAETASRLAEEGFVVFAVDYRSTLGAPPDPVQIEKDNECGFRYSMSVAEEYGGDPTQPITFVGFSFGASLAMEGALNAADYGPDGTYDDCFSGVPHADLLVGLAGCYIKTPEGFDTGFDPNRYDGASADVAIVLVGGSEDDECEAWQSSEAAGLLADSGYNTAYIEIEGSNHFEIIFHDIVDGEYVTVADAPEGEEAVQIILEAIDSQR